MEVIWSGVGFLIGLTLWMPFILEARVDTKLIGFERRIKRELVEGMRRDRRS